MRDTAKALGFAAMTALGTACGAPPFEDGDGASRAESAVTEAEAALDLALRNLRFLNQVDLYADRDVVGVCSDVEGRVAAGGDIGLARFSVAGIGLVDLAWGGDSATSTSCDAGGRLDLYHGSIGGGRRGVAATSVNADHYAIGNLRAACDTFEGETWPRGDRTLEGAENGARTCGPRFFPHATFADAADAASAALAAAFAHVEATRPEVRSAPDGIEELVFAPYATDAFYTVSEADLERHWVFEDGARYFVQLDADAATTVRFVPKHGVAAANAYAVLHLPAARELVVGRSADEQVHLALTILAPHAAFDCSFDIVDGGVYVADFVANPSRLPIDADVVCGPGGWHPGTPVGQTVPEAGCQVNHAPFTASYPDSYFGGVPLP